MCYKQMSSIIHAKKMMFVLGVFLSIESFAQNDTVIQRIFLIGDAGVIQGNSHPVLDWLTKNVDWNDEKNVALFLGDNIYPDGLPDEGAEDYDYTKKVIDYQLNIFKGKKAKAFFVPGNHDWNGGKIGGWERGVNQTNYINSLLAPNIQAWPLNGCPGPIPIELNEKVVLVMMNTQWFLHIHDKPGPESSCEARNIDEFTSELRQIVETHPNQLLVLVMHHPMYTYGVHGGAYTWRQHIFPFADAIKGLYIPLPLLGSVYPLARGLFGNLQDTYHPLYRTMINEIEEVLKDHPNPITVAGHEHSLQLIIKDSIPHIVSGSAAKLTRLRKGKNSLFSILDYGFAVLEISKSGKVETKFYNLQTKDLSTPLFAKELKTIVPVTPKSSLDTLLPVIGKVNVQAGTLKTGAFRNFLWGKNYRPEWRQTVSVPMLDLGKEAGGLKPVSQQGGSRTLSLSLAEKNGKQWTLRPIEKFPEAVIPADLRSALRIQALANGVSGAYPYAALSVPVLEQAAGIPTLKRKLVYVPDDPRLERFRTGFKNTIALLEEREPSAVGKTMITEDLFLQLVKKNEDKVDQKAVLRARLMDNFVMDFDRHEGKWRWATKDTAIGKTYFPIPYDHDQAFFKSEGLFTRFVHQPWFIPQLQGFSVSARNIKTFNKTARNFDRLFLTELSAPDWEKEIDIFLNTMTDEVIETALKQQPQEVQKYAASEIVDKLKKRKTFFRQEMMEYYRFVSKIVTIVGSNQKELFTINKMDDGKVLVTTNKIGTNGAVSAKVFERTFEPSVTKELRVFALEGNDSLVVKGQNSPINIRIIGGPGNDNFVNEGKGKRIKIYDASFEKNTITGSGFDNKNVADPEVNRYNRLDFKYNYVDPGMDLEYNKDDGLRLGLQLEYFKQGFRKEPYGMRQYIRAEKAFGTGSYRFAYESDYTKALKNFDVSVRADFKAPVNITNFFGLGNNTAFDKSKGGIQYYRVNYDIGNIAVLAGRQLQSWMRVGFGPSYQYFTLRSEENKGKFVSDVLSNGLNNTTLYQNKSFLGAEGRIDINSKNNAALPSRGALIKGYARQLFGLNANSKSVLQAGLDLRIFMSLSQLKKFVFATRFGMGRNFGGYEFQQAQYLSGTENLRGFRRERFAGRGMAFNNSEIRLGVVDFKTYIFQGTAGVLAFHDVGRVWVTGEKSGRWHNGYGGGIWVAPIRRFVIVGSLAFSKEESALPLLKFGFQF